MMERISLVGKARKMENQFRIAEKALKKVLKTRVKLIGSGRTDKGVHALSQYANFKLNKKINDKKVFLNSMNFF